MNNRKEAIRAYKERKIPRGIYVVRCTATGKTWVGSSPNLEAARNLVWMQLKMGLHRNVDLQGAWNDHGEATFEFEIAETLDPDILEMAIRDELKSKRGEWAAKLDSPIIVT